MTINRIIQSYTIKISIKYIFLFIFFNTVYIPNISSQQTNYSEYISPELKTVLFHRSGWSLSNPIYRLNSEQKIVLTFDEPGSEMKSYYYSIFLCDANWNESGLIITDYQRGAPVNPLTDYSFSFNTTFDYIHYQIEIPNEDVTPTRSGNYIIKVFENSKQEIPVLIKKFMVTEPSVTISGSINNTVNYLNRATHQEIDFEISHTGFTIHNPIEEISVSIIQNGRNDNVISGLKPLFFRDGFMNFNYNRECLMEGGNEFRYFDIRSTRFLSDGVKDIIFLDPFFHANIFIDSPRLKFSYQYRKDLNGRYYIEVQEQNNSEIEADYLFTHFTLKTEDPNPLQKIYINGALTNWQINSNSEMVYNQLSHCYEKTLLLKQGYYNYQYLVLENGITTLSHIEGNFEQTENDYLIIVYYKGISDRNHRIIGAEVINSGPTR